MMFQSTRRQQQQQQQQRRNNNNNSVSSGHSTTTYNSSSSYYNNEDVVIDDTTADENDFDGGGSASNDDDEAAFLTLEETTTTAATRTSGGQQQQQQQQQQELSLRGSTRTERIRNTTRSSTATDYAVLGNNNEQQHHDHHHLADGSVRAVSSNGTTSITISSDNEQDQDDEKKKSKKSKTGLKSTKENRWEESISWLRQSCQRYLCCISGKTIVSMLMFSIIGIIVWDSLFTSPEKRILKPDFSTNFLLWVQKHPSRGLFAILFVIAIAVVFMIPIGTPLTLGCGYIYKGLYGWKLGLTIATIVSMFGSGLGAVCCFLIGRYLMRERVRTWIKIYPIFDAIDIAAAEHGLRIMAMLYLTPILPLGPVSYMCGTTSMHLSSFIIAKIASLPLMLLYCFIGASTGALILGGGSNGTTTDAAAAASNDTVKSIEENEYLIVSGILLSFVMISGITHYIRKELNKILERQGKHKPGEIEQQPNVGGGDVENNNNNKIIIDESEQGGGGGGGGDNAAAVGGNIEMGGLTVTAPRRRKE